MTYTYQEKRQQCLSNALRRFASFNKIDRLIGRAAMLNTDNFKVEIPDAVLNEKDAAFIEFCLECNERFGAIKDIKLHEAPANIIKFELAVN